MRRAGRIVYNLAVVVSLLLFVACVGVWVRSYWVSEYLVWSTLAIDRIHYHEDMVRCERGGVEFSCSRTAYMFHPWVDEDDFHRYLSDAVQYPVYQNQWEAVLHVDYQRYAALGFEMVPRSLSLNYGDTPYSISEKSLTSPSTSPHSSSPCSPRIIFCGFVGGGAWLLVARRDAVFSAATTCGLRRGGVQSAAKSASRAARQALRQTKKNHRHR